MYIAPSFTWEFLLQYHTEYQAGCTRAGGGGYMQKSFFRRNWIVGYALGIVTVAVGVFMMFQQESFLRIFIVLLGLFATLSGISSLISLRRLSLALFFRRATVIRAIVSIAVGLFALI